MWLLLSLGAAIFWGLNYALIERVVRRISPFTLVLAELVISLPIVLYVAIASGRLAPDITRIQTDTRTRNLLLASVFTFLVASICIALAISAKNATSAGLVEVSYPLFVVLFGLLIFHEHHVTPSIIVGAALIFVGVGVIAYRNGW